MMSSRDKFLHRMAHSLSTRYIFFSLASILFFAARFLEAVDVESPLSFTLEGFEKNNTVDAQIELHGDAVISDSDSAVISGSGRIMYKKPIRFVGATPGFSTYFSFSITKGNNGETLAFVMAPRNVSLSTPAILKVVFGNHVGIEAGRGISIKTSNLSALDLVLDSGEKLHSWIDYNGVSKRVEVRLSKSRALRPSSSLISYPVDFSYVLRREEMLVSLISLNRKNSSQICSVYTWSFVVKHGAPYTMHSEPLDPYPFSVKSDDNNIPVHGRKNSPWKIVTALVIGAVFGGLVASVVFFLRSKAVERHPVAPVEYSEHPSEKTGYEKVVGGADKVGDTTAKEKV